MPRCRGHRDFSSVLAPAGVSPGRLWPESVLLLGPAGDGRCAAVRPDGLLQLARVLC